MKTENVIHIGDCAPGMTALPAECVDLAFCDPPFNIGYDYGEDEYQDNLRPDEYLAQTSIWMGQVYRVLKPNGTFWLSIGDAWAAELKVQARQIGFHLRSWVIWYYTFGVNSPKKFTRSHAHLFYFTKHKKEFTFNASQVRVPSARQLVYKDKRANPDGRLPDDTWILRPQDIPEGFEAEGDVWSIPRICGTFKQRQDGAANQMPEQLMGRIIRACSNEGDIVLDPMVGTGTTLAVAKKLKRKHLGFELSESFAERAIKRVRAARPGDPLDGAVPQGG
mgnify:CR=1 FL=1